MADSLNTPTSPETEELTLLDASDVLAEARHFVRCAEMAVADFGADDRVNAVQSATMTAIERIRRVEDLLSTLDAKPTTMAPEFDIESQVGELFGAVTLYVHS